MADRKSFILYKDQKQIIDELTDEEAGKLIKAIYKYNADEEVNLPKELKLIFIPFKTTFDRDQEKWQNIANKRSEAGKKHTGNQYTRAKKDDELEQNGTNGTNGTVSVSVNGSVNDNVNVSVNDSVSVNNIPDTPDTIFTFSKLLFPNYSEKDLERSCKKFYNYYKEKNWKGVENWQGKLEMWLDDDINDGKIKETTERRIIC